MNSVRPVQIAATLYAGLVAWITSPYFFLSIIAGLSLWQFTDIAINVVLKDEITLYDQWIVQTINPLAEPRVTQWMVAVTMLGDWLTILLLMFVFSFMLLRVRAMASLGLLVIATLGGTALNLLTKALIHRPRPVVEFPILNEIGFSFPSGHAMIATCFCGTLLYLAFIRSERFLWHVFLTSICFIIVVAVSLSRVYLGVHYPSDILGGCLLGIFWVCVSIMITKRYLRSIRGEGMSSSPGIRI